MTCQCEPANLDRDDVRGLLTLHFAETRRHSPREACHVLPLDSPRDDARTLLGVGELKSMRTDAGALGRGVGGAILDGLVAEARARSLTRISLETGSGPEFAAALRLY